ncbi:MAG: hypothetical protein HUK22_06500, partial [Thermoguttaceae bacterium]|nr:hypothetical protein [Thermoguttaceae bacterium]
MKTRLTPPRRGVVLLLILGLTAMFALSILAYMVVTTNMADTARNLAKLDAVSEPTAESEVGPALKNVLVGSNNLANPIAPFSILENMYGDWTEFDAANNPSKVQFNAEIKFFPGYGFATITPIE